MHIQQDIIVLWPLKVYQREIFWENECLIYDINDVTHQSVWEYFIIHRVCTCLFLSSPSQESKHIISLNFRERRLKWGFLCSKCSKLNSTYMWWHPLTSCRDTGIVHPIDCSRTMPTGLLLLELTALSVSCFIPWLFWKGQGLYPHPVHPCSLLKQKTIHKRILLSIIAITIPYY